MVALRLSCLCLLYCCCSLFTAEARWEMPDALVPQVQMRIPLKIINFGEFISQWDPPPVDGITWHNIARGGHVTQIVNGVKTEEQTILVTVSFARTGDYTIPPVKLVSRSGESIATREITVTVKDAMQVQSDKCFAEATISKDSVVPGEEFTLHYKVGTRARNRYVINNDLGLQLPQDTIQVSKLRSHDQQQQYDADGEIWIVNHYSIDLKFAKPGTYSFGGQQEYGIAQSRFVRSIYQRVGEVPIKPATITVTELPSAGQPPHFGGLIGPVTLKASLDRERIPMGKNAQLEITASDGQVDMLNSISVPDIDGLTVYEGDYELDTDRHIKTHFFTLVPQREGNFIIPSIEVPYYDSQTKSYRSVKTDALSLTVVPGKQRDLNAVGLQPQSTTRTSKSDAGMLLPSPLYGDASSSWSHDSSWLALLAGILLGVALGFLRLLRLQREDAGPDYQKLLLKALQDEDLLEADRYLHQLLPRLSETDQQRARDLIAMIESARFGGQQLGDNARQMAKALEPRP